jgi:hypothetical protein
MLTKLIPATTTVLSQVFTIAERGRDLFAAVERLDLLRLEVDLSRIVLEITAVQGPGNLLGNLLCALVGLLDPPGLLQDILDAIADLNAALQ